jgi:hypothetical protein
LTLSTASLAYAEKGFSVFPVAARGKLPLIPESAGGHGVKDATTDVGRVTAWWTDTPEANIGCRPGPQFVVLDVDGPLGLEAARVRGLLTPPTLTCLTGRVDGGQHLYFRHPGFYVGNRQLAPHLDVRGDAGYVLLPPSIHPSGARYRWRGRLGDVRELPPSVRDELQRLQQEDPPIIEVTRAAEIGDVDRRVEAYLERVGGRGEGDRNSTGFRVAAFLVRDLALDDAAAWQYLVAWNATNAPPLGERELRRCLMSAKRHGRRPRGSGLVREAPVRPMVRGVVPVAAVTPMGFAQ